MSAGREDGLLQRLLAHGYDRVLARTEAAGLRAWREDLLVGVAGTVLELGPGTGLNLEHYGDGVQELILAEPAAHMRGRLRQRLAEVGLPGTVVPSTARRVAVPDQSVDVAVATLVLCSVVQVQDTLATLRRVLKPGGRYVFIEHVGAAPGTFTRRAQGWVEPLWRLAAGNCHLTRDTEGALREAGFVFERLERAPLPASPALVAPAIRGVALLG